MRAPARPLRPLVSGLALALGGALAVAAPPAAAQDAPGCFVRGPADEAADRQSPLDSASVRLGGAEIKVCYGAPSARGREIMGGLVPYDTPWRMGANEATALHLPVPARVAGVRLDPDSYSLYAIPGAASWEIVLNTAHDRWGIPIDDGVREADVGTATITPETTDEPIEQMQFSFERTGQRSADLIMEWERTQLRIPVEVLTR